MKQRDRFPITVLLLLVLLTLVLYHSVLFRPGIVFGKDTIVQGYPISWYQEMTVKNSSAPTWFPYMMSGFPTTPAIYPTDVLSFFLPVTRQITWRYILHSMVAAALMFLMMRRFGCRNAAALVGGIAFGFSAFFISKVYAGHGFAVWTGTWIPLTFLLLDQTIQTKRPKYAVLTGAVVGLQILGQHPQYVFYTILAMTLYAVWKILPTTIRERNMRSIPIYAGLAVIAGVFAFALSAHYLLPFLQLTHLSNRGGGTGYDYAASLSMHPGQILTAIIPSFWGSPAKQNSVFGALYWDSAMYIGLIPFILAIVAFIGVKGPRASYFKALAILSILLALGDHTPIYKFIYHIPGFSMVRAPAKMLFLYTFAAAALASYGMELLLSAAPRLHPRRASASVDMVDPEITPVARKVSRIFSYSFYSLAAGFILWLAMRGPVFSIADKVIRATRGDAAEVADKLAGLISLQTHGLACAVMFAGLGALVVWALLTRRLSVNWAAAIIIGISFLDLAIYADPLLYTVNARKEFTSGDREAIRVIQSDPAKFRVLPLDTNSFQYAEGVLDRVESVNGYYPISLARYASYVGVIENKPRYVDVSADISNPDSPLIDMLNVKYVLSNKPLRSGKLTLVHSGQTYVYRNERVLSRAYIVRQAAVVSKADDALKVVASPGFNPKRTVVLEGRTTVVPNPATPLVGAAKVLETSPTAIRVATESSSPAYLVLSEVYYPDWKATVDGKPVKILPADYLFRAVQIPAGKHEVRMVLASTTYRIGLALTLGSLAFIIVMLLVGRQRSYSPEA